MSDTVIHYEKLWEMCEKTHSSQISETEILGKISASIDELKDIYRVSVNSQDKQLVQGMKFKSVGRLLMALTALSNKEGLDVYLALKDQLDIIKLKEQAIF